MERTRKPTPILRAPPTRPYGARRDGESLQEFLARIRRIEKDIFLEDIDAYLADLPPDQWAEQVTKLWEHDK